MFDFQVFYLTRINPGPDDHEVFVKGCNILKAVFSGYVTKPRKIGSVMEGVLVLEWDTKCDRIHTLFPNFLVVKPSS